MVEKFCRHGQPPEGCCSMCDGNREERRIAAKIMAPLLEHIEFAIDSALTAADLEAARAYVREAEEGQE